MLYNDQTFNVAIHVRRGDVTSENHPLRFTSGAKLSKLINRIKGCLGSRKYQIWIFSISEDPDLRTIQSEYVRLVSSLDIFDVLDHLISADLLVTSKSSIGYLPAIIGERIVLYEPFWHPPLSNWLNVDLNFEPKLIELLPPG